MAGKDGSTWKHNWLPVNAPAVALKAHRSPGTGKRKAPSQRPDGGTNRLVTSVGKLRSGNLPRLTVEQEYQRKEVQGRYTKADRDRAKRAGFKSPADYQASITAHVRKHGVINSVQASHGALDEGYHRYAAMRQLKKRTIPARKG